MRLARRFWIAAACTLSLLLGTSVAQAQQTKLLPNDSELVLTFNLQQILNSKVAKENKVLIDLARGQIENQLDEKGVAKHLKAAGFDVFKDLTSITFAVPGGRNPEEAFILMEGNFDAEKIEGAATEASKEAGGGLKVVRIGNTKAFEVSPKGEQKMYVGVLNSTTMIACATQADFKEAVARLAGSKEVNFKNPTIKSLMQTVNNKQSISFVATSALVSKIAADKVPEGAGDKAKMAMAALDKVDGFSAAVTIEMDIDLLVGVNAKDNKTANDMALAANIGIGFAKTQLAGKKDDPNAALAMDVLNSIRANAQGSNLVIRGQITFETLGKLLKNLPLPNN